MESIGNLLKQSGFGTRESGSAEAEQNTLTLSQVNEDPCQFCLQQGARGFVRIPGSKGADGVREVETIYICQNRHQCQKLGKYFNDYVDRIRTSSGMTGEMKDKTVNQFIATEPWQQTMKKLAVQYISEYKNSYPWLLMSGQSGCGKTHLCAAISNKLLSDGIAVKYTDWLDLMRSIKSFDYRKLEECRNASGKTHLCAAISNKLLSDGIAVKYTDWLDLMRSIKSFDYRKLEECRNARALFLDDLYKRNPSPEESKATMELINHRYRNGLLTIVTSERTAAELLEIDEAVVGRIIEKCGRNWCAIGKSPERNYRMAARHEI